VFRIRVYIKLWWKTGHFEHPGVVGRIILKWILIKLVGRTWTGFLWIRTEMSGGLL
jgi:hypothetical protein